MAGVTAIDFSMALVTVTASVPTRPPTLAVTAVVPALRAFTNPGLAELVDATAATAGTDDAQVAVPVNTEVVPSVYGADGGQLGGGALANCTGEGVTVIDFNTAAVTVTDPVAVSPPLAAVIVAVPGDTPRTEPADALATAGFDDDHEAVAVRSWVEPSL